MLIPIRKLTRSVYLTFHDPSCMILSQCDYGANVWTVLTYFGHPEILEQLNGAKVHSLENVMTLEQTLHGWFDNLQVWFEETVWFYPWYTQA